jgi:peptidoglycan/xylan/chitin deacetylase (PgdA/CDA1 family)
MGGEGFICLMYHELERPPRPLCQSDPGYVRYIMPEARFHEQICWLHSEGRHGLSVGEALASSKSGSIVITFDDGCESDLLFAAPILKEYEHHATFYVTAGFLGKPGYLSPPQLRELHALGFEIGCHSMTHAYLNDLSSQELEVEVVDARSKLEDVLGSKVEHLSCPGGRWDERVLALAREAGYLSVANSRAHANSASTDRFRLGRVAIMRETSQAAFKQICNGDRLWKIDLGDSLRGSARRMLGNVLYDRVRDVMLRRSL